jgi:Peptidase C13 family
MRRRKFIAGFALAPTPIDTNAMISGNMSKLLAAVLFAFLVLVPAFAARSAESGPRVAVVAFGLFGDQSVFESEANGAARIVAHRFGGSPVVVRANTRSRSDATVETLATVLDSVAKGMDAENDVLALILTSHGSRAGLAVRADGREDTLWPQILAAMLNHAGVRHRVVIISACYSGVFIPLLANSDTLVITAADAEHPSFGCQDGAQWTYFGDAFFNATMRRMTNLRDAFDLARTLVRERERRNGFHPSNPQMAGGENIERRLTGNLEPADATVWLGGAIHPWPVQQEGQH